MDVLIFCKVFQYRHDGTVSFHDKKWREYKNGFGELSTEFWIGELTFLFGEQAHNHNHPVLFKKFKMIVRSKPPRVSILILTLFLSLHCLHRQVNNWGKYCYIFITSKFVFFSYFISQQYGS